MKQKQNGQNPNAMMNQLNFQVKFEKLRNEYFKLKIENYDLEKQFIAIEERIEMENRIDRSDRVMIKSEEEIPDSQPSCDCEITCESKEMEA